MCAFKDGEVKVIGDEPENTDYDPGPQRKLYREAKMYAPGVANTSISWPPFACLSVKPVGEPDAADRHVRFDERGWETEPCRMLRLPRPSSTLPNAKYRHVRHAAAVGA
jgi:hypothetical protein